MRKVKHLDEDQSDYYLKYKAENSEDGVLNFEQFRVSDEKTLIESINSLLSSLNSKRVLQSVSDFEMEIPMEVTEFHFKEGHKFCRSVSSHEAINPEAENPKTDIVYYYWSQSFDDDQEGEKERKELVKATSCPTGTCSKILYHIYNVIDIEGVDYLKGYNIQGYTEFDLEEVEDHQTFIEPVFEEIREQYAPHMAAKLRPPLVSEEFAQLFHELIEKEREAAGEIPLDIYDLIPIYRESESKSD